MGGVDSIVGPSLEVVPFENSQFLDAKRVDGSSRDGSIEGGEDGQLFELGGNVSSKEKEEEEVGYPLVP